MKAILISIQSPHACNILNLIKLWEIRKKFPKDYVGWVYIYCTKNGYLHLENNGKWSYSRNQKYTYVRTGKVIARFWCDKVVDFWNLDNIMLAETCLSKEELGDYLGFNKGYAIHITNLEIFDKPKELSEFYKVGYGECAKPQGSLREQIIENYNNVLKYQLTRAPQSWCYIEV